MKNLFFSTLSATVAILLFSILGFSEKKEKALNNFEAPIGSIVVWPGPQATIPKGWLLCNGHKISRTRYPELCQVILDYWAPISGLNNDIHKLPDLQGMFLRGANNRRTDNYSDPDKEGRIPSGNGASNEVGSFQLDEIKNHTHSFSKPLGPSPVAQCGNCAGVMHGKFEDTRTSAVGGNESRPKNAYVNYIIKAE